MRSTRGKKIHEKSGENVFEVLGCLSSCRQVAAVTMT